MSAPSLIGTARLGGPAQSSAFTQLDEAMERVTRVCEELLREVEGPQRAERLVLLFESEAQLWSQLYDIASLRLVWRAALAAEAHARRNARIWQERATATRKSEAAPAVTCLECGVRFAWDESPAENRCAACAEVHEWNHPGGAALDLDLDHTPGGPPIAARSATCWTGSSS